MYRNIIIAESPIKSNSYNHSFIIAHKMLKLLKSIIYRKEFVKQLKKEDGLTHKNTMAQDHIFFLLAGYISVLWQLQENYLL